MMVMVFLNSKIYARASTGYLSTSFDCGHRGSYLEVENLSRQVDGKEFTDSVRYLMCRRRAHTTDCPPRFLQCRLRRATPNHFARRSIELVHHGVIGFQFPGISPRTSDA